MDYSSRKYGPFANIARAFLSAALAAVAALVLARDTPVRAQNPPADAGLPSISINDATVTEGDSGTVPATFTVTLSEPSPLTVTVDYLAAGHVSAWGDTDILPGTDFLALGGTLVFPPGTTARKIGVPVFGDRVSEGNGTFVVGLSNPVNATLATAQATGTILDDDAAGFAISDVNVTVPRAGTANAVFTVNRSPAPAFGSAATVAFHATDGTATAPADYTTTTGTLTFPAGQISQTVSVPVKANAVADSGKVLFVDLTTSSGPAIVRSRGTATIYEPGFYTLSPCRVLDTRSSTQGPALSPLARSMVVGGVCGIPNGATAVSLNITVVSPTADGYLRIFPFALQDPFVATINYGAGQTRTNNTIVGMTPSGVLAVFCEQPLGSGTVDLVVDVNGYFE